jgi:hypothetical protein
VTSQPPSQPPPGGPGDNDPVARNRATPRRVVPGRPGLGEVVTRRTGRLVAASLWIATAVLVAAVILGRGP